MKSALLPGGKQFLDHNLEFRQQFFREDFAARKDAFELQAELGAVIDLHVVVTRVHHPKTGHANLLVNILFDDRVRPMIVPAYDFHCQEQFPGRSREESQVGANGCVPCDLDARARRKQLRRRNVRYARVHRRVQALADGFVTGIRRRAG